MREVLLTGAKVLQLPDLTSLVSVCIPGSRAIQHRQNTKWKRKPSSEWTTACGWRRKSLLLLRFRACLIFKMCVRCAFVSDYGLYQNARVRESANESFFQDTFPPLLTQVNRGSFYLLSISDTSHLCDLITAARQERVGGHWAVDSQTDWQTDINPIQHE